jgi:SPP1 family predicted phage head-tail adaptor
MISGRMRDRVTLYRPVVHVDKFGAEETTYEEVKTVWAEIQHKDATTTEQVGEFFMGERIDILIRIQHEVRENWRVRQLTGLGHLFHIRNIDPRPLKGLNRLICERVNE